MKIFVIILLMIVLFTLNGVGLLIGEAIAKKITDNTIIISAMSGICAVIPTILLLIYGNYDDNYITRTHVSINLILVIIFAILYIRSAMLKNDIEKKKQNKIITENDIKKDN